MTRSRFLAAAFAILALAALVRVPFALSERVVERDGIRYVTLARAAQQGDLDGLVRHDYAPGYPLLVAGAATALGAGPGEAPALDARGVVRPRDAETDAAHLRAARLTSAVLGALTALAALALGACLAGPRAGLLAGLLAAAQPYHALLSFAVLSEASFGAFLASGLALVALGADPERRRAPVLVALGSLSLGLAYLVRPEALAALIAVALVLALGRRALRQLAALVLPLVLVAAPFLIELNRTRAGFQLSGKKDWRILWERTAEDPAGFARALGENGALVLEWGFVPCVVLALFGLIAILRRSPGLDRRARRTAWIVFLAALAEVAIGSTVRAERRFALIAGLILLPFAGVALDALLARRGAVAWTLGLLVLLGSSGAVLVHKARPTRAHLLLAAEAVRENAPVGRRARVLAYDPRIPYYAGAEALEVDARGGVLAALADTRGPAPDVVALRFPNDAERATSLLRTVRGLEVRRTLTVAPAAGVEGRAVVLLLVGPP